LIPIRLLLFALVCALFLAACANAPYRYQPADNPAFIERATAMSSGGFEVRASIPAASESEDYLGIDVYGRGIQPVWLEVRNDNDTPARIVISSIDPKYFPPAEVAWFFKGKHSKQGWMDLEKRLIDLSMPRLIEAGATESGFVFTHRSPGTKAFNVDIYERSVPAAFEQFTFFLRVPGFVPDYTEVRFEELYPESEQVSVRAADLPLALAELKCCTTNPDGTRRGRPVNLFFVSEPLVLLRSLLRAGWAETPSGVGETSAESAHHLFGRAADGTFRKPRNGTKDRSEMGIWKTPVLVDGKPLWAAQLRHAIGREFRLGDRLFGVRLDPDSSEGRNYVLQTFWYAQTLMQWGLSPTGILVPEASPELDFQDNPWFTIDNYQIVMWLSPKPVPMNESRLLDWHKQATATGAAP
jgi:hypothetical protein